MRYPLRHKSSAEDISITALLSGGENKVCESCCLSFVAVEIHVRAQNNAPCQRKTKKLVACRRSEQDSNLQPRELPIIAVLLLLDSGWSRCRIASELYFSRDEIRAGWPRTGAAASVAVNFASARFFTLLTLKKVEDIVGDYRHALCQFELSDLSD